MLSAVSLSLLFIMAMTAHGTEQENDPKNKVKTPVTISPVTFQTIRVTEESVGRIEARFAPLVSAEETGLIIDVATDTGQYVEVSPVYNYPRADLLAELAAIKLHEGDAVNPSQMLPHYLGPSQAEVNWKKRQTK